MLKKTCWGRGVAGVNVVRIGCGVVVVFVVVVVVNMRVRNRRDDDCAGLNIGKLELENILGKMGVGDAVFFMLR